MKKRNIVVLIVILMSLFAMTLFACSNGYEEEYDTGFTVTFNSNGGSVVQSLTTDIETGRVARPQDPTRYEHNFLGWYTNLQFEVRFNFDNRIESDITLFARWERAYQRSNLQFHGNGATSGSMSSMVLDVGDVVRLPLNQFTRVGHTFFGWAVQVDTTARYTNGGWFYVENLPVIVLFAVWQPNVFNITLYLDGGQSQVTEIEATFNQNLPRISVPSKVGYAFIGFFTERDGEGVKYYDNNMTSMLVWNRTEDSTLFAYWTPATTRINFVSIEESYGSMNSISTVTHSEVLLPQNNFEKKGHTFIGWNTHSDGSGDVYLHGEIYRVPAVEGEITLYAMWQANIVSIIFDDNFDVGTAHMQLVFNQEEALLSNSFIRRGHSFVEWNTASDGSGESFADGQSVLNLTSEADATITLYAIWKANTYVIAFNRQGGTGGTSAVSVTYYDYFPFALAPSKVGYLFAGFFSLPDGIGRQFYDSSMNSVFVSNVIEGDEIYAYWIPRANILVYNGNGATSGSTPPTNTLTDNVENLPISGFLRTGYNFVGWSLLPDGQGQIVLSGGEFFVFPSNNEIVLYAIWSPREVIVNFDGNEATGGSVSSMVGYSNGIITLPSNAFNRLGYTFVGWGITASDTSPMNISQQFTIPASDNSITLYAIWSLNTYTITYNLSGGVNSIHNPNSFTVLSPTITLSNPTRRGFTFISWTPENNIPQGSAGNRIFTAIWEINVYNVFFILNGGTNTPNNIVLRDNGFTVESDTIFLEDPERSEHVFQGWSEGWVIEHGSVGDRTFTAVWDDRTYTITYVLSGGQNGARNPGRFTHDTGMLDLYDPTRIGHQFLRWEINGTPITAINTSVAGNVTVVAIWQRIEFTITYVLNGGVNDSDNPSSFNIDSEDIFIMDLERTGFMFNGWYTTATFENGTRAAVIEAGSVGNRTFYARWTVVIFNIVYAVPEYTVNDNPESFTILDDIIILNAPSLEHFTFVNWYLVEWDDYLEEEILSVITQITGFMARNIMLLAVFVLTEFNITFDLAGGINHPDNLLLSTFNVESAGITIQDPTREGFTFAGWANGQSNNIPTGSTGDIHFEATWEVIVFTINYDLAGGVNHEDNPISFTIESGLITLLDPAKVGYTFTGWLDSEGNQITSIPAGSTGNITLTATWTANTPPPPPQQD